MKTTLFVSLLALVVWPLFAQTEKGATPISSPLGGGREGATRAVVIGISDYQDPGIPDLRFADKDAEAFANFLRSPAGGSLDNDHLKMLTNDQATAGRIAEALDALIEQTKEGDQVIIYFSGHGDVERKTVSQPGFLLAWDAPSRVYMGGGTYSLAFLQEVVSTLSTQNLAKVTVITDACHAGKLSGSQIGGAQLTAANLARQFANEVKILSCQPNEFSLEGEQWGGGRGVFSYHLVEGLFGLADRNGDGMVTVGELDRYLEDNVTAEAAPQSQVPLLLGNKTERLATVDAAILADLKKSKGSGMPVFAATEGRGLEDEVLAKLDSGIVGQYFAFKKAVAEKRFFPGPATAGPAPAADELYTSLSAEPGLAPLHGFMKRNYAAALQDDAQQVVNNILMAAPDEYRLSKKLKREKYEPYSKYLNRAAELLGEEHYMYPILMARKFFFEGHIMAFTNENRDTLHGEKVMSKFLEALKWQPDLPHAYYEMMMAKINNFGDYDTAEEYAKKAAELAPGWVLPYARFGYKIQGYDDKRADVYIDLGVKIDAESPILLNIQGLIYQWKDSIELAEKYFKKAIAADSNFILTFINIGEIYFFNNREPEAEPYLRRAYEIDSTHTAALRSLGIIHFMTNRKREGMDFFLKAIELDPLNPENYYDAAIGLNLIEDYETGLEYIQKAIKLSPNFSYYYVKGQIFLGLKDVTGAEESFRKYLDRDSIKHYDYTSIGAAYVRQQLYGQAEIYMRKAVSSAPENAEAADWLGFVLMEAGQYEEAEIWLNKAMKLDPALPWPYENLTIICIERGRLVEAESYIAKALKLTPYRGRTNFLKAALQYFQGRHEEVWGTLEYALKAGFDTLKFLDNPKYFTSLKADKIRWKALMKKYLPEVYKD